MRALAQITRGFLSFLTRLTVKKILMAVMALGMLSCKSGAPSAKLEPGTLVLDKWHSKLTAVAMKNEVKPVELHFPDLEGSLSTAPFKASVRVAIDTLDTGDKVRDNNVKTLFFEVAKAAINKGATFDLTKLEGDPTAMKEGESFPMKATGTLSLHGAKLTLSGPLNVTRLSGGGYSASFKDLWTVNIKDAGMLEALENLNKNCPQPHRVGLNVALQGELVFVKP